MMEMWGFEMVLEGAKEVKSNIKIDWSLRYFPRKGLSGRKTATPII